MAAPGWTRRPALLCSSAWLTSEKQIIKNQIIVINALLDFILFLYNHKKSSINENKIVVISIEPHKIIDKLAFWKKLKLIFEKVKNFGNKKSTSNKTEKTK